MSGGSSPGVKGSHSVQVRVLGPFEVLVDDRLVPLTQPRLQVTLAVLAMAAGDFTSVDRITDAVWGEQPPENARGAIQVCVHRLRAALGAELISTEPGGYRFACPPEQVDALQLLRLTRNVPARGGVLLRSDPHPPGGSNRGRRGSGSPHHQGPDPCGHRSHVCRVPSLESRPSRCSRQQPSPRPTGRTSRHSGPHDRRYRLRKSLLSQ